MASSGKEWLQSATTELEMNTQAKIAAWEAKMKKGFDLPEWHDGPDKARSFYGGLNALGLEPADPAWKCQPGTFHKKLSEFKVKVQSRAELNARKRRSAKEKRKEKPNEQQNPQEPTTNSKTVRI